MLTTFAAKVSPVRRCFTAYTTLNPPLPMRRAVDSSYSSPSARFAFLRSAGASAKRVGASSSTKTSRTSGSSADNHSSSRGSGASPREDNASVSTHSGSAGAYREEDAPPGASSPARETQHPIPHPRRFFAPFYPVRFSGCARALRAKQARSEVGVCLDTREPRVFRRPRARARLEKCVRGMGRGRSPFDDMSVTIQIEDG